MARSVEDRKASKSAWYKKNREKILAHYSLSVGIRSVQCREWRLANPERNRENNIRWRKTSAGKNAGEHDRFLRRFRQHGLTLDQYHAMIESQDFQCRICGIEPDDNYGGSHDGFHIDHHHVTGRIRGLLCKHCNVGIGMLKDSADICTLAASYLSRS